MRSVGRPAGEELDRIEELAEMYFHKDRWAIDAFFWDDGDVHIEAFSTIGTGYEHAYPDEVNNHRQIIVYERDAEILKYKNRIELKNDNIGSRVRVLNEIKLEW